MIILINYIYYKTVTPVGVGTSSASIVLEWLVEDIELYMTNRWKKCHCHKCHLRDRLIVMHITHV